MEHSSKINTTQLQSSGADKPAPSPTFGETAEVLHNNGYPVVPIWPGTKATRVGGWNKFTDRQDEADIRQLMQQYPRYGVGIVTGRAIVTDIDVTDAVVAAEIVELAITMLGPGLARTGNAPKTMLLYQAEKPFPKQESPWFQRDGEQQKHRVEVLGRGQQFVAFAIHPDTNEPYRWHGPSPLDVNAADLPVVTEDLICGFLCSVEEIFRRHGYQPVVPDAATITTVVNRSAEIIPLHGEPPAVFVNRVSTLNEAAKANVPAGGWFEKLTSAEKNDLLRHVMSQPAMAALADGERLVWLKILFALADAEQRGTDEAHAIALAWSKSSPRFRNDPDFEKDWRSFRPKPDGITVGTVIEEAEKAGIDLTGWRDGAGVPHQPHNITTVVTSTAPNTPASFFQPIPFDQASLRPVSWLILGLLLRGGITAIASQGGGSKTAFAVALGTAAAAERQRFGPFSIHNRPGGLRVAFISAEEDRGRLGLLVAAASQVAALNAAERAQVETNLLFHDAAASGWRIGEPRPGYREDMAPEDEDRALKQLADALGGFDILILDTLAALFAMPNENDNNAITTLMRRLTRAARQADCTVLLLHHTPKMTREAVAQQRGEATLVRGGSAITNSARVVLTITAPTKDESGRFVVQGFTPDRVRRIEHAKINDLPPMEPAYFNICSEKVKVHDGNEHAVRAVEFIIPLPAGAASIPDAVRNVVMKAIDVGTTDDHGATVPLSPGGGARNQRDAISHITKALMNANATLTEQQAKGLASETLKDLRDHIGCVIEQDVTVPQYKKGGQRNGTRERRGLVTRWELAPWVTKPSEAHSDIQPVEGAR